MADNKDNPFKNPEDILKNYKPQVLENTWLNSSVEILTEDMVASNNVVGLVPGTDPVLKNENIVVGGHLDHVKPQLGKVCNGADEDGWAILGDVGNLLIKKKPDFDPRNYGFDKLTPIKKSLKINFEKHQFSFIRQPIPVIR